MNDQNAAPHPPVADTAQYRLSAFTRRQRLPWHRTNMREAVLKHGFPHPISFYSNTRLSSSTLRMAAMPITRVPTVWAL